MTEQTKSSGGLLMVFTGNGKGKTTSAMGMLLRAVGHGMKVCVIQFMKGDLYSGEWDGLKLLGDRVELYSTGKGFCGIQGNPYPHSEHRENAQQALKLVDQKMSSGDFDLIVLDEINNALQQLNTVTQRNAANSEQINNAAHKLESLADRLNQTLVKFKLDNN